MLNANCCSVEVDKFCSPSIRKLSTVQRVACSPLEVSYLKAKYTFPLIEQDPEQFKDAVQVGEVQILNPGESVEF